MRSDMGRRDCAGLEGGMVGKLAYIPRRAMLDLLLRAVRSSLSADPETALACLDGLEVDWACGAEG